MSMWNPVWRTDAEHVAVANGWKLTEQADGRLAFQTADLKTTTAILFTGNEQDVPAAISRAAAAQKLQAGIQNATAVVAGAAVVTRAIQDGKRMSLSEKMATLAARSQAVPKALEARADALLPRLDALEAKGHPAFDGLESVVADAEKGVAAAETAMRLLTNGGPLPGSSGSQSGA